jgi:hypothetical protein
MAIYHLDVSHVSKAKGGSASAKNDYIEREGKYAKDAQELVASGHEFMPNFCKENPRNFWRAADEHERKNAQVCSEIRVALPKELSASGRQDLVQAFIRERLKNQPCTWAIHRGNSNNPHAHIMYSARTNEPSNQHDRDVFFKRNGAKKNRDFIKKDWLIETREVWANQTNYQLKCSGSSERIDHRTLEVQCREIVEAVEAELEKPEPRAKSVQRALESAQALDRKPPKRRFWHRKALEPEIRLSRSKKRAKDRPLTAKIKVLKSRASVILRNFELVDTLARTLSRQMETKARVREANEKKAQKRVLESEKRGILPLKGNCPQMLSAALKNERKRVLSGEIDIEKLLQEVAKTPDRLDKSLREIKAVRLESARKLRWWIVLLVFCLGLVLGMVGTTFSMKSSESLCKLAGFGVQPSGEQALVWCLSAIKKEHSPPAKQ